MKTINQVKTAVKPLVTAAAVEVSRLCDDVIMVNIASYDAIDGSTASEKAAAKELKAFGALVEAMGYEVTYNKFDILIDSYNCNNVALVA